MKVHFFHNLLRHLLVGFGGDILDPAVVVEVLDNTEEWEDAVVLRAIANMSSGMVKLLLHVVSSNLH